MYHMLPFAYRPQNNYSRSQHGDFQNVIEGHVNKIINETDIVDSDNIYGRKLFNSMDTFFSYGLLTGDGAYWRFIKSFLPRAEQKMLVAECGNSNDRFLSIAWLKTSFNKATLHFLLVSLNNKSNKTVINKFYHKNACLRNNGLLEAVTQMIENVQIVQFAFYTHRQLRPDPVPAAIIETAPVQISSRAAARQRKLTEKEASQDTVPNIVPSEIPSILTQAIDQDVLLDELVRNRHNRLNTEMYDAQHQSSESEEGPSEVLVVEEKLEDVMTKKMSCAHMESLDPDGIEQILASVEPTEPTIPEYQLADGEYQMSQGDILHLAINVFEKSGERIIECFKVIEGFHSPAMKVRYFVMTNYNLYAFKYRIYNHSGSPGKITNLTSEGCFVPTIRIPHDRIKTIKISIDNLSFRLEANEKGFPKFLLGAEQESDTFDSYIGAMAGLESGAHMINSLINVVEHSSRQLSNHAEVDDHIGYMVMLQPNLEKELGRSIDIRTASMCFWLEQSLEERERSLVSKSGYLFKTTVGNWMKSTEEAEQKYCLIIGMDLHMFADSNCRTGDSKISLKGTTVTSTGRVTFQLKGNDGAFEFECSTQEDHAEWVRILTMITENEPFSPFLAPCLAVLTETSIALVQEGERFWTDGFLRLLNEVQGETLKRGVLMYPPEDKESYFTHRSPLLCLVTDKDAIHYFFVRFPKELDRLAASLQSTLNIHWEVYDEEFSKTVIGKTIYNTCLSAKDLWRVTTSHT